MAETQRFSLSERWISRTDFHAAGIVNFIIAQDARRCIENAYPLPSALWDGKENPHSYTDIPNPWGRLRWCRYGLDLLQKRSLPWWA